VFPTSSDVRVLCASLLLGWNDRHSILHCSGMVRNAQAATTSITIDTYESVISLCVIGIQLNAMKKFWFIEFPEDVLLRKWQQAIGYYSAIYKVHYVSYWSVPSHSRMYRFRNHINNVWNTFSFLLESHKVKPGKIVWAAVYTWTSYLNSIDISPTRFAYAVMGLSVY
jgi:hypothetical protein